MQSKKFVLPLVSLLSIVLLASCNTNGTSPTEADSTTTPAVSTTPTATTPEETTPQPTTPETTTTPETPTTPTTSTTTPSTPSTPVTVEWEVKIVPVTGVTLTLDRPDGKYEEGETVTITARITDEGVVFQGFESEQVDEITFVKGLGETYTGTFVMPAGDVSVTAKTETRVQHKVSDIRLIGEMAEGWEASLNIGDTYYGGSEETLTITGEGIYSGVEVNTHVYVNGVYSAVSYNERKKCFESDIVLPEEDAEILVVNTANAYSSSGASISLVESEHVELFGFNPSYTYSNLTAYFRVEEGYQAGNYGTVQYRLDGGEWKTVSAKSYLDWGKLTISSFGEAKKVEVKITATAKEEEDVNVTYEGLNQIVFESINDSDPGIFSSLPDKLPANTTIDIAGLSYTGDTEHYLQNVTVEGALYFSYNGSKLSFRTGTEDIKIVFEIKELVDIRFDYKEDEVLDARATAYDPSTYSQKEITAACPGDTFQVEVKPASGKLVTGISIDGEEASFGSSMYNSTTGYYTFNGVKMPEAEESITIGFVVENAYAITIKNPEGETIPGTLNISGGADKSRQEGEKINFTFEPSAARFYATKVTCVNMPDLEITFDSETQSGSFIMPASDVELTFEYGEYENTDIEIAVSSESIWPTITPETGDMITDPGTSNFIVGEKVTISARFDSESEDASTKDIAAYVYSEANPDGVEIPLSTYSFGNYRFELTIEKGMTKIELRAVEKKALTAEIVDSTDGLVKLNYAIIEDYVPVEVDSLDGNLFIGTQFTITVDESGLEEGQLAVVKVIDVSTGEEIAKDWEGYYTVIGDIRIEISIEESRTVSWNAIESGMTAGRVWVGEDYYFLTNPDVTSISVPVGTEVTLEIQYGHVKATITIDGKEETIDLDASDYEPKSHTFVVNSNVTIVLEEILSEEGF